MHMYADEAICTLWLYVYLRTNTTYTILRTSPLHDKVKRLVKKKVVENKRQTHRTTGRKRVLRIIAVRTNNYVQ